MSDWTPGDLALCVNGRRISPEHTPGLPCPFAGAVYLVDVVSTIRDELALRFADGPRNNDGTPTWAASRFRKIKPHTPDAEDRETIRLLNGERIGA